MSCELFTKKNSVPTTLHLIPYFVFCCTISVSLTLTLTLPNEYNLFISMYVLWIIRIIIIFHAHRYCFIIHDVCKRIFISNYRPKIGIY